VDQFLLEHHYNKQGEKFDQVSSKIMKGKKITNYIAPQKIKMGLFLPRVEGLLNRRIRERAQAERCVSRHEKRRQDGKDGSGRASSQRALNEGFEESRWTL